MDAWVASVCYNRIEAKKYDLPMPKSWKDLTQPVYQGHVVMPNPNSSGTGYLDVASWLQTFGEEDGWAFMDGLHQNIDRYTHSGSKPCKMAACRRNPDRHLLRLPWRQADQQGRADRLGLPV